MAERIVSPGVFTQENDLSFLPAGIGEIGAVIIGRTERGPAFEPTIVRSMGDFELQFGSSTAGTYVPFTVKEYIRSAGSVTIVRVLGLDGYNISNQVFLYASGSTTFSSNSAATAGTDKHLLGLLHATADDEDQQCTSVVYGTQGGDHAANKLVLFTTASGLLSEYEDGKTVLQITSSGDERFAFVAVDNPIPGNDINTGAGSNSRIFFLSESVTGTGGDYGEYANNLVAAVNTQMTTLGLIGSAGTAAVTAVSASGNGFQIEFTASSTGTTGNSIAAASGSSIASVFAGGVNATGSGDLSTALSGNGVATFTWHSAVAATWSFDKSNANYFEDQLPVEPGSLIPGVETGIETYIKSFYVYSLFNSQSYGSDPDNKGGGYGFTRASHSFQDVDFNGAASAASTGTNSATSGKSYSAASTPWVVSQTVGGNTNEPLFKFHTLSHGNSTNMHCKVSIVAIKAAGSVSGQDYGSFTVTVRKFDDTDTKVVALESFANCNLDPNSPNYIARRIGDRFKSYQDIGTDSKLIVNGDYENLSKYIRVEVDERVRNGIYSPGLIPFGHEAYLSPFYNTAEYGAYPAAALVTSRSLTTDTKTYFGFNFDEDILNNGMKYYLAPLSDNANKGYNQTFKLESCFHNTALVTTGSALNAKRFSLAFQGGYDGVNPATPVNIGKDLSAGNSFGFSFASTTTSGYTAYKKAIDTISNPDEIDINLIVMPGILSQNASNIVQKAIDVCEDRGDCFFIFDGVNSLNGDAVSAAVAQAGNYDTNYAATYYPWVKILDATVNRFIFVPPSVVVPGVISFNDRVAFPWFAPAGLNRGSLGTVNDVYTRLTHSERDDLYEGKVNPIAVFPGVGVCVWGQKTLQTKPSALDRINVRRLLIKLKKFIASSTKYLVFEQNTTATRNRFLNIVNPYLETVQQQQGLYAFKVVMDETNNTPDVVDRNQMKGEIFLQPAKAAEFIIIDFNIMRTGASFEE